MYYSSSLKSIKQIYSYILTLLVFLMSPPIQSAENYDITQFTNLSIDPIHPLFINNLIISGDGNHIAFTSTGNYVNTNEDRNLEIFILDIADKQISQITQTAEEFSFNFFQAIAISNNGSTLAFTSNSDLTGANPQLAQQLFTHNATSGTRQLTQLNPFLGFINELTISGNGEHIAFTTDSNLTGDNPDFSTELFLAGIDGNIIEQITNTLGQDVSSLSISDTGNRISFISNGDLTGNNPDGSNEAFLFDTESGISQITNFSLDFSINGSIVSSTFITADGHQIIFGKQNFLDVTLNFYFFDTRTNQINPIPHAPELRDYFLIQFSNNGTRSVFISDNHPAGDNPDFSSELFVFDFINQTTQITSTLNRSVSYPTINNEGNRIAFVSNADLVGDNPDGSEEIFLAELQPVNNLRNISYNGQIPSAGIKLGFIVEQATTVAVTAESFASDQTAEVLNPILALTTLHGAPITNNDTCNNNALTLEIGRETASANDACIVIRLQPDLYIVEAKDENNKSGNALVSITATLRSPATLRNLSYNGPIPAEGIKLGFITESEGEYIVTAESIAGEQDALPNAQLNLTTLNGTAISDNDDCPEEDSLTHLNRPLANPQDACIVNLLPPGAYISEVGDTRQRSGNALISITKSLSQ